MSRKNNVVTSSLQALLRQDSDVADKLHIATHLTKKVEVAVTVLPTTPLLRNVALETVSSGFLFAFNFEQKEIKEDSPLYLALSSSCDLISSLLSRSPSGWCDTIFLWGIDLLLRLSSSSSTHFSSTNEKMEYLMSKPLIKSVIQFVSISVEYRVNNDKDVINCILDAVRVHKTEMGWLLAHITSIRPVILVQKLVQYNSSLPSVVITTLAKCLNLLVESYPNIIQDALLKMVQCIAETTNDRKIIPSLRLLIQLMLQSTHILELMAKEILGVFTPQHIYNLMTSAVESGLTDGSHDDDGEIVSDDEGAEPMEHDGLQEVPLLPSLSSLLLQLSGANAVTAVNLVVGCVMLCIEKGGMEDDEEDEDGEINPHTITKLHLLKATKIIMNDIILIVSKSANSVLLNNPLSDSAPLKFTVSLQDGLTHWTALLADSDDNSLVESLSQLIASVGVCSSEIIAANVLSLFLRKATNKKLPLFISLHVQYHLQHSGVTTSFLSESVSYLRKDSADIGQWCSNMYQLTMATNDSNSCLKTALPSSLVPILSLLPLTMPTSAITLMSFICPFIQEFVSVQSHSDIVSVIKQLVDHFFHVLSIIAQNIINKGVIDPNSTEIEYQLCLCRSLVTTFTNNNDGVENFTYSEIFTHITSMDMAGYLMLSNQREGQNRKVKPAALLLSNTHCQFPFIRGSLLNTRQTQHSGSLQKRLTPDPQTDSNTNLHSPQSMAVTHSNDHIICLLSEITGKSTDKLASLLMDTVAPSLVIPLGAWPEVDFSTASRQTVELHLNIKRNLDQSPILWKILLLISTDPRGFMKCSSLVQSLLDTLTSIWSRRRLTSAVIYNNDLTASEILIQSLTQAGWIPRPLCYVSELFNCLTSEEVSQLHQLVYQYVKDNYGSILSGCQVPNELDAKTKLSLKSLMIRNIDQFGHVYHRFAITTVSKQ